jgi:hypothetical protein
LGHGLLALGPLGNRHSLGPWPQTPVRSRSGLPLRNQPVPWHVADPKILSRRLDGRLLVGGIKRNRASSSSLGPRSQPAPTAMVPQSRGGSRSPRTIRIRQDASVTTAEPAIAVTRDQVIDRVADHPWDQMNDPCPLPARKLARNAQHGFEFDIALTVRQECKGIRAIRIDAELLSERQRPASSTRRRSASPTQ